MDRLDDRRLVDAANNEDPPSRNPGGRRPKLPCQQREDHEDRRDPEQNHRGTVGSRSGPIVPGAGAGVLSCRRRRFHLRRLHRARRWSGCARSRPTLRETHSSA